jgi:DNA-binding CsgD family transcriptional regulator
MADPKIIVATESTIICRGVRAVLDKSWRFDYRECDDLRRLKRLVQSIDASAIIVASTLFEDDLQILQFADYLENESNRFILLLVNRAPVPEVKFSQVKLSDPEDVLAETLASMLDPGQLSTKDSDNQDLSVREKSILREIALGKTSRQIADELFISAHTVVTHRKNINRKLNIKTTSGLTVYAILNNIITVDAIEKNQ